MGGVDYLIVGLGNPGRKYENTRHNIGFMVTSEFLQTLGGKFTQTKRNARIAKVDFEDKKLIVVNPHTFMNNSGEAVSYLMNYFKISPNNLFVICDDLDLKFGTVRMRPKGGSGGHKGLASIINHISTENFSRLRVGIGKPENTDETENYVLREFTNEEQKELKKIIEKAAEAIECFLKEGIGVCMNKYNAD